MVKRRIQQLGLFLATAGASLLLSGAAHAADTTSPSQNNQSDQTQTVTVTGDQSTTVSSKTTVKQSSAGAGSGDDSSGTPPASTSTTTPADTKSVTPPADSAKPPAAAAADQNPAANPPSSAVVPVTSEPSASAPAPEAASYFAPVTIIQALVPHVVVAGDGSRQISTPNVQPSKPATPEPPAGSPTGALGGISLVLGQTIPPLFSGFTGLPSTHRGTQIPELPLGLVLAMPALITFASLLRRWGYAVSARGSDPHAQLVYEFASPVMNELVPVRP